MTITARRHAARRPHRRLDREQRLVRLTARRARQQTQAGWDLNRFASLR